MFCAFPIFFHPFFFFILSFSNIQFQVLNDIRNLVGCRLQTFLLHSLIVYVERCCAFDIKYSYSSWDFNLNFIPLLQEMDGRKKKKKNKGTKQCTMYIRTCQAGRHTGTVRHFLRYNFAHFCCTLHIFIADGNRWTTRDIIICVIKTFRRVLWLKHWTFSGSIQYSNNVREATMKMKMKMKRMKRKNRRRFCKSIA